MQAGVRFRGYRASDLDAMYALDVECFEAAFRFSRSAMRRFAEAKKARVAVGEIDGEVVGFAILHIERSGLRSGWLSSSEGLVGYVVTLDVAPAHRRRGLARMMMLHLEAEARSARCVALMLHVFGGNVAAQSFYEGLGWEQRGTAREFYGEGLDALVYVRTL